MTQGLDALRPDDADRLARARADLRMGAPVALIAADGRGALALAAETAGPDRWNAMRGLSPVLAVTDHRAETLKARVYDGDLARIIPPAGADIRWLRGVSDPKGDLMNPLMGPLRVARDGETDLHRAAIRLAKSARLLPAAVVAALPEPAAFAAAHDLTLLPIAAAMDDSLSPLHHVVDARVPLGVSEAGRLHVFRPADGGDEHYAVEIGHPARDAPVLARLHSACFTGDVLGSLKCDCGPQLHAAMQHMADQGAGVLLYLNQEGRGIGLANKMRAYSLQDQGFDTVEANHRLGFEDDERDFRIGADILRRMGFSQVRLLTNNPAKVARLQDCGLAVTERVPLQVGRSAFNAHYLATKAAKSGHLL